MMQKKYFYLWLTCLFIVGNSFSQTTETFETETFGATTFTDNGQTFTISSQAGGTFAINDIAGTGYSGTTADNKYIDNSNTSFPANAVTFTVSSNAGALFTLKSIYLFLSRFDLSTPTGSVTITGKNNNSTVFSATSTSFNSNLTIDNGYTKIDFATFGGNDNSSTNIDQFVITTTDQIEYVALDAMKWSTRCVSSAPTATANQNFCIGATIANLSVTGTNIKWYTQATAGTAVASSTALVAGNYYASQTILSCESQTRTQVAVTLNSTTFTTNPTSQTVCVGDTVSFNSVASGTSGATYQWQEKVGAGAFVDINNGGVYSNATTASLTINGVTANLINNNYRCIATASCGSATSDVATLNGNQPTTVTTQPTPQTACIGQNATFAIEAIGFGVVNYQWQEKVGAGTFIDILEEGIYSNVTSATLTISAVTASMTTNEYRCIVSATCGSTTSNAIELVVNPLATVNQVTNVSTTCINQNINSIRFSSPTAGGTIIYNWINNNTAIGLPEIGTGSIRSFAPTNSTTSPISATITVTPTYTNNGVSCDGTEMSFSITVNPAFTPFTITSSSSTCSTVSSTISGPVNPNYTYVWERSLTGITSPDSYTTFGGSAATQVVDKSGIYRLNVTNEYGCQVSDTIAIKKGDYIFNGSLTASDAKQTGRTNRFSQVSTCALQKTCAGIFTASGERAYDSYTFANPSNAPICATVGLSSGCGTAIFGIAYLNNFNPSSTCANYLADMGSSFPSTGFMEVIIPASSTIVVVVHEVNSGVLCTNYQLIVDIPRDILPISIVPSTAGCNPTFELTAPIANSYLWSPSGETTRTISTPVLSSPTTYSVSLGYGNKGCSREESVVPSGGSTSPIILCPANINLTAIANQCSAIATYITTDTASPTATISYKFTGATIEAGSGNGSGSSFNVGLTTVVVSASNTCGVTNCSFTVSVTDTQSPVFTTCPASNTAVNTDLNACGAVVNYTIPSASDNCTAIVSVTQTSGLASGAMFPIGTTTNVFKATDQYGNFSTCEFSVTIKDLEAPAVIMGTISNCFASSSAAIAEAMSITTIVDNCTTSPTIEFFLAGTCDATIVIIATDQYGNETLSSYATRIDNVAPIVTAGTISSSYATASLAETAAMNATSATDNCIGTLTEVATTTGTCSALITVTTTDECGNSTAVTYTTRIDNTAPVVTKGTIANCYATVATAETAALNATSATDNCIGMLTETASTIGTCNAIITITTTDRSGNATSVSYTTRIDNVAPIVTIGTIATSYPTVATAESAALTATSATDNCTEILSEIATTIGLCEAIITIITSDECGNATAVTYTTRIDNTAPVVTKGTIANCYATVATAETAALNATSATDNCIGMLTETASTVGTCNAIITITTTDSSGNATSVSYTTRIDNVAPIVTIGTIATSYPTVATAESAALNATSATDNCTEILSEIATTFGLCEAIIKIITSDECGNATAVTYTTRIDNTAPVVTKGTIANCYATVASAETAALNTTTATDNCIGMLTEIASTIGTCNAIITITTTDRSGNATSVSYTTRIDNVAPIVTIGTIATSYPTVATAESAALTATSATDNCTEILSEIATTIGLCEAIITIITSDECGNATAVTCTTRIDNTAPAVTKGTIANCYATVASAETAALNDTSATDNCIGMLTETASTVGTCNAIITIITTDTAGNATSVSYTTRIDNVAPIVTAGIIATSYPTVALAENAALTATSATDNCTEILSEIAITIGLCEATITIITSDECGNATAVTYTTRIDNTAPVVTKGTIANCYATVASAETAALNATSATDNCIGMLTEIASTIGTCNAIITITTTDTAGNATSVSYTTRIDNVAPIVTAGIIATSYPTVALAESAALNATSATDNCTEILSEIATTFGLCEAIITIITSDECGNATAVTYTTRIDNTAPVVTKGTIANCYATVASAETAALNATSATDNCIGMLTETGSTIGTCNAIITITTTDTAGNATAVSYTTRIDNVAPIVTAGIIATSYPTVALAESAALNATSATDNCTEILSEIATTFGLCEAIITIITSDECGNATAVTYTTRIDNIAPVVTKGTIANCYATVASAETAALNATSATDNCIGMLTEIASTIGTCNAIITITTTDIAGNATAVSYTTRIDNVAPIVTAGIIATSYPTVALAESAALNATSATDNCTEILGEIATTIGLCEAIITIITSDECGNATAVTYTTRIDNTAPVVAVGFIASNYSSIALAQAAVLANTLAIDNCSGALTQTISYVGTCGPIAFTVISKDTSGNSTTTIINTNIVTPIPTITANGATTFCAGGSVLLTSSSAIGNLWSTGETTQSIIVSSSGNYLVSVSANGCTSETSTATVVSANTVILSPSGTTLNYIVGTQIPPINLVASGVNNSNYTYTVSNGILPLGINLVNGVIGGTPTLAGSGSFTITATAINGGCSASQTFAFVSTCPNLIFSNGTLPNRNYNQTYSQMLAVSNTTTALTYSISNGSLPTGYGLSSAGILSGTSVAIGTFTFTVLVTDLNGCSISKTFSIGLNQIPITVTAILNTKVFGTIDPTFTYSVVPNLQVGDSFTGSLSRMAGENVGIYAVNQGTLSAGANYIITYVSANFTITKAPQTIIWNQNLVIGCDNIASYQLTAIASSGLPISYTSQNNAIATISGTTISLVGQGTVAVTALQSGNSNYLAATNVMQNIVVSEPNLIRKHWRDVLFFDNSSNNYSNYQWFKNGVAIVGANQQYFKETGDLAGTYYATASRNGNLITTCSLIITASTPEFDIKILPNPVFAGGLFDVETTLPVVSIQGAQIYMFSYTGALVGQSAVNGKITSLFAPNAQGVYIVKLILSDGKVFSANLLVK